MTKFIYQPKGKAREYALWACNLYNGCSNHCSYCYNGHGVGQGLLGAATVSPKTDNGAVLTEERSFEIFKWELDRYRERIIVEGCLHFSFVSDPCLPETYRLNLKCIQYAIDNGVRVQILTKCSRWMFYPEWYNYLREIASCPNQRDMLNVGFTLTGCDELEGNAPSNAERLNAMEYVHNNFRIQTWASIEPVIDIDRAFYMMARAANFCDLFRVGLLSGGKRSYTPDDVLYFMQKVKSELKGKNVVWKDSVMEFIKNK